MDKYTDMAKSAVITAAGVLLVIYVMRKAPVISPMTAPLVNKALNG